MKIGQLVTVYYPCDVYWFCTKGVIIDLYDNDLCVVQNSNKDKIIIQSGFLKIEQ